MGFDFDDMAYPDIFLISGEKFKGSRTTGKMSCIFRLLTNRKLNWAIF